MSRHTHISTHIPQASMCTTCLYGLHPAPCTQGNIAYHSNPVFLCIHPCPWVSPQPHLRPSSPQPEEPTHCNYKLLSMARRPGLSALLTLQTTSPLPASGPRFTISPAKICRTHSTSGALHYCSLLQGLLQALPGCLLPFSQASMYTPCRSRPTELPGHRRQGLPSLGSV